MIIGGVVPVVNVKGIQAGQLHLDGATVASIYLGDITQWDDPQIKRLNPKLALPSTAIAPVYRSDGSGTNFLFRITSPNQSQIPVEHRREHLGAVADGDRGQGQRGCGQHDHADRRGDRLCRIRLCQADKMAYTLLTNKAGTAAAPSAESFQAAAANADWVHADSYYLILTDQAGAKSWPITGASFILVYKHPEDAASVGAALKFFAWRTRMALVWPPNWITCRCPRR